ncbi:hypothetical protein OIY81_3724 [Cryptosporidium canis]|nr:hypothetical protein OIY81_3724 [Cryptosporidium canis]
MKLYYTSQIILLHIFFNFYYIYSHNTHHPNNQPSTDFPQIDLKIAFGKFYRDVELTTDPITSKSIKAEIDHLLISTKLMKDKNKHFIGKSNNKHLIASIESKTKRIKFPFYSTFFAELNCNEIIRMITYDYKSRKFFNISVNCQGKIHIHLDSGKLFLITPNNKSKNVINYYSYNLENLPKIPEFLKTFRNDLISFNFKHKIDQKFPISDFIPLYLGYLTTKTDHLTDFRNKRKIIQIPFSNQFRYLLFGSKDMFYAFPVHDECFANVNIENAIVEHICGPIKFYYDLKNGILNYETIEILTMNIGGIRVLTNENFEKLFIQTKQMLRILDKVFNDNNKNNNTNQSGNIKSARKT